MRSLSGSLTSVYALASSLVGEAFFRLRCCANRAIYHFLVRPLQTSFRLSGHSLAPLWTFAWLWLCPCSASTPFGVCECSLSTRQFKCSSTAAVLIDYGYDENLVAPCCPYHVWVRWDFDGSLGYPGEGPVDKWSILSSNVGSFIKDSSWKGWDDNVVCLQETRIGRNNFRNATKSAFSCGKNLILGDLLPGLFRSDGSGATSHGGVATIAPSQLTIPFQQSQDITGLYDGVFKSKRVQALWCQVRPSLKVLVFNFYGKSGASASHDILKFNDELLSDVFQIASQFGDIPVLVVGDFQLPPSQYPSVATAVHFADWFDPLTIYLEDGSVDRPITYSRDCTFTAFGEHCSSIDGILLNQVAFSCLQSIGTVDWTHKQHRPVRAVFNWETIFQVGPVHVKFAALDISRVSKGYVPKAYAPQTDLWDNTLVSTFGESAPEELWFDINQHALTTLIGLGATWQKGRQQRATPPVFQSKKYCPGQFVSGDAASLHLSCLHNAQAKVFDIQAKAAKPSLSDKECDILYNALRKLNRLLRNLKAPFTFHSQGNLSLLQLHECHLWLQIRIDQKEHDLKQRRIRLWKDKIRDSASSTRAYIFHHLKNKSQDQPNNLVTTQQGHIIYQPVEALTTINEQWDSIFAANIGHDDPVELLKVLWPYLSRENKPWQPPPITGADVLQTVQARHVNAAPGLDGWRTLELQSLPLEVCELFAAFFRRLEANVDFHLPNALTTAKMVILNKPGPSSPLNKRLITILPPLLLAYTGTRFRQAKEWQASIMPPAIVGGIAGRHMTTIPTTLRLEIDEARSNRETLVGLKLDKSKCFDRIIPAFVAIILLALGCPKHVVSVFVRQYNGMRRHLSYRGWTLHNATTSPNGVAQGCSFSLIAINAYMRSWLAFLHDVPHITCRIYIDDIYLWASIQHVANLQIALEITRLWDTLVGQKLNTDKSVAWSSSSAGRKTMKLNFPGFLIQDVIDVLGTKIYTSQRNSFDFPEAKTHKILLDIRNIGALPLPRKIKSQLIGAKAIPQCSYAAHITKIPKAVLDKIQAEITQALWGNRPHWRAKHLVLGFLAQPHRVDPYAARAYNAILDFMRFLHLDRTNLNRVRHAASISAAGKHSLFARIQDAFSDFGISLDTDLCISFGFGLKINLQELSVRDITPVLKQFAVQMHYDHPANLNRKDFFKPQGFIDTFHSKLFAGKQCDSNGSDPPLRVHFEAQIVGCTITNDRRFAAKFAESPLCRFCQSVKESLVHILECPAAHELFQFGPAHEFGSNFSQLGIVEHPWPILRHRLQVDRAADIDCTEFTRPSHILSLWTDGSVFWNECFPLTAGGYSVIKEDGTIFAASTVSHLALSSFSAELWAVIVATLKADCCIRVYSDCQEVVTMVNNLVRTRCIPRNNLHLEWWQQLLLVVNQRSIVCLDPVLSMTWIPAHLEDSLPVSLIPAETIQKAGTTRKHVELNRIADRVAKQFALQRCPITPKDKSLLQTAVLHQQEILTRLNKYIGFECSEDFVALSSSPKPMDVQDFRKCYPGLAWNMEEDSFDMTLTTPASSPPHKADMTQVDWEQLCDFLSSLRWTQGQHLLCTYQELAFLFHLRGFRLHKRPAHFQELVLRLRQGIVALYKQCPDLPGTPAARATKCIGKVLPQGALTGILPYFAQNELALFARVLAAGAGRFADSWSFSFDSLL